MHGLRAPVIDDGRLGIASSPAFLSRDPRRAIPRHGFLQTGIISRKLWRTQPDIAQWECDPADEKPRRDPTAARLRQSSAGAGGSAADFDHPYDNHAVHFFLTVMNESTSGSTHWHAAACMEMRVEKLVAQMEFLGSQELKRRHSYGQDRDSRWLHRFMHHLLVVSPLPMDVAGAPPSDGHVQDSTSRTAMVTVVALRYGEDGERDVTPKTTAYEDGRISEPVICTWSGYWIGPDYEDGWGFVEAVASPAEHGCPRFGRQSEFMGT